jgi:Fic family protein
MNSPGESRPTQSRQRPGTVLLPSSLVRGEQLQLDAALWEAISVADRALGALGGYVRALADGESLAELMLLRESVLSNRMEGGRVTLAQLLWWRADQSQEDADADLRGELRLAANYLEAWDMGARVLTEQGYSTKLVRALHAQLFRRVRGRDSLPGQLRDSEIWIGPAGSTFETAWFVPPAPGLVAEGMAALQRFLTDSDTAIAPCLKVAIAYYQLETIYPFVDGNGRVARMLLPLLFSQQPGVRASMLSFSAFFNRDRTQHFRQLQGVRERGEWASWFAYFLQAVRAAAADSLAVVAQVNEQRKRDEDSIVAAMGGASTRPAMQLLEAMASRPLQSVSTVGAVTGRTFANANQLVGKLERLGILREITGRKRNRRYCYAPLVELLVPVAGA